MCFVSFQSQSLWTPSPSLTPTVQTMTKSTSSSKREPWRQDSGTNECTAEWPESARYKETPCFLLFEWEIDRQDQMLKKNDSGHCGRWSFQISFYFVYSCLWVKYIYRLNLLTFIYKAHIVSHTFLHFH